GAGARRPSHVQKKRRVRRRQPVHRRHLLTSRRNVHAHGRGQRHQLRDRSVPVGPELPQWNLPGRYGHQLRRPERVHGRLVRCHAGLSACPAGSHCVRHPAPHVLLQRAVPDRNRLHGQQLRPPRLLWRQRPMHVRRPHAGLSNRRGGRLPHPAPPVSPGARGAGWLPSVLAFPCAGNSALSPEAGLPVDGSNGHDTAWVMAYYAGYDAARLPIAEIDWSAITHLAVAFYLPDGSGGLNESLGQGGPALGHALVAAAHANGRPALASIGGAGQHDLFAASAASANRPAFVARIATLVGDYGYDGVDLDWEPIRAGEGATIGALAQDLKAALPGKLLTLPIGQINPNAPPDLSYLA